MPTERLPVFGEGPAEIERRLGIHLASIEAGGACLQLDTIGPIPLIRQSPADTGGKSAMAKLDFHFSPGACSLVAHIALEEAGAAFTPKPTYTPKCQNRTPEYRALSPQDKVPRRIADGKTRTAHAIGSERVRERGGE